MGEHPHTVTFARHKGEDEESNDEGPDVVEYTRVTGLYESLEFLPQNLWVAIKSWRSESLPCS